MTNSAASKQILQSFVVTSNASEDNLQIGHLFTGDLIQASMINQSL
jgi:hypothetical protein